MNSHPQIYSSAALLLLVLGCSESAPTLLSQEETTVLLQNEEEALSPSAVAMTLTPNDPRYDEQWGYENIGMPEAWGSLSIGASYQVRVGVIDTGINGSHEDFDPTDVLNNSGNIDFGFLRGPDQGPNAADSPRFDTFHGSHVGGTIAADTNNTTGVSGMLWGGRANIKAELVSIRTCRFPIGICNTADTINGIYYAAGVDVDGPGPLQAIEPVDVINMSLGGSGACTSGYEDAIATATAQGIAVVVAAGNSGNNQPQSPASCPSVTLTVGATDESNTLASFSNFGFSDLSAPGVDILSTVGPQSNAYAFFNGTSMATPHVAGAAAFLKAIDPSLTPTQIRNRLISNAESFGDPRMGAGILRVPGALAGLGATAAVPTADVVSPRGAFSETADFIAGEFIVELDPQAEPGELISRLSGGRAQLAHQFVNRQLPLLVKLPGVESRQETLQVIRSFLAAREVLNAYPNYILTPQ